MTRDAIISSLRKFDAALRACGATGLYIYGSRVRGEARADSDVDLFIDYEPAVKVPNLFRLVEIEQALAKELGVPVSIATRRSLHPLMQEEIEREALKVL